MNTNKVNIIDFFTLEDFKDTIPLAALGARVCYSNGDLQTLLNDPRIIDKKTRSEFLSKLGNYKHFSVFSHSFTYKKVGELNALKIASTYFKTHYNPEYPDVIGVSLRHYLENLLKNNPEEYKKAFEKMADFDIPIKPIAQNKNVSLIGLKTEYDGYSVFFIDNVSRTLTHQLIRHTTLNFSQRSQRYVREEENYIIIPEICLSNNKTLTIKGIDKLKDIMYNMLEIINENTGQVNQTVLDSIKTLKARIEDLIITQNLDATSLIKIHDELSQIIYSLLVYGYKIKREDARFILPHGRKTTIVVSAPIVWIKDFIEKRNNSHAQWEIRNIAKQMEELLKEKNV